MEFEFNAKSRIKELEELTNNLPILILTPLSLSSFVQKRSDGKTDYSMKNGSLAHIRCLLNDGKVAVAETIIPKGTSFPQHAHGEGERETTSISISICLVQGKALSRMRCGEKTHELEAGYSLIVEPNVSHRLELELEAIEQCRIAEGFPK